MGKLIHCLLKWKIAKLIDRISIGNCIFIIKCFSCERYLLFPNLLTNIFYFHNARFVSNRLAAVPSCNALRYAIKLLNRFGFMFPYGIIFSHAFQIKVCDRFLAMNLRTY